MAPQAQGKPSAAAVTITHDFAGPQNGKATLHLDGGSLPNHDRIMIEHVLRGAGYDLVIKRSPPTREKEPERILNLKTSLKLAHQKIQFFNQHRDMVRLRLQSFWIARLQAQREHLMKALERRDEERRGEIEEDVMQYERLMTADEERKAEVVAMRDLEFLRDEDSWPESQGEEFVPAWKLCDLDSDGGDAHDAEVDVASKQMPITTGEGGEDSPHTDPPAPSHPNDKVKGRDRQRGMPVTSDSETLLPAMRRNKQRSTQPTNHTSRRHCITAAGLGGAGKERSITASDGATEPSPINPPLGSSPGNDCEGKEPQRDTRITSETLPPPSRHQRSSIKKRMHPRGRKRSSTAADLDEEAALQQHQGPGTARSLDPTQKRNHHKRHKPSPELCPLSDIPEEDEETTLP